MNIKTYNRTNDLCLLVYDDIYYYIGCLDLPQKDWSIERYNQWLHTCTTNLIPLNDTFVPQILSHYGLKIVETADGICESLRLYYNRESHNGVKKDFRALLIDLYNVTDNKYREAFENHFKQFYQ